MIGTLPSSFAYKSDLRIANCPHTWQCAISVLARFFDSSLSSAHIPFTNYWNTAFHMLMTQFSETPAGFYSTISFEQRFFPATTIFPPAQIEPWNRTILKGQSRSVLQYDPLLCRVIPDRLYYMTVTKKPVDTEEHHFFCTDEIFRYYNYFLDFGPLNICQIYQFCRVVSL